MNIQRHYRELTKKLLAIIDNDETLYRMRSRIELSSSQTVDNIQTWVETMFPNGFDGCPRAEFPFLDYQYMRNFWMGLVPSPKTPRRKRDHEAIHSTNLQGLRRLPLRRTNQVAF